MAEAPAAGSVPQRPTARAGRVLGAFDGRGVAARCWRTHGHGEAARAGERRSEIAGGVR